MMHAEEDSIFMENKPQLSESLNKQGQEALQFQTLI
jgi:hypothetical protein